MRTFVRTTPRYDQEAQAHHCAKVVARFRQRAEQSQNEEFPGERFSFPGNYFKKRHENFRTIYTYEERKIQGQDVRCFVALCVIQRGNASYDRFHAAGTSNAERATITGRDHVDWNSHWLAIEDELRRFPAPAPLPQLGGEEIQFIDRDAGLLQTVFDYPIYETKGWVDQTSGSSFEDPFKVAEALDGVIMAVESDETLNKKTIPLTLTPYGIQGADEADRKSIEYCRLQDKAGRFAWFLIGLGTPEELQRSRTALGSALPEEGIPDFDRLANACRRAYPYDMINDKDRWAEMERDRDGNFVLSEEELRIVSGPVQFPLFVTGRAGSGKSTMLQYLFADFFFRYLERRDAEPGSILPPVYLSYSDNLVENAQHLAEVLFEKNHVFQKKLSNLGLGFANDVKPLIPDSFLTFQRMVRRCIEDVNPEAGTTRFRPENHVSYARFRAMWMKTFGRDRNSFRDFGPELSWHVIRTYIKGWDSEAYCEPEDYDEIGAKNQSVTPEVFRNIFNRVWPWYQKLQQEGVLWDDQDLVRYCLAPDDDIAETCVSERFSAVFCDESQDFTRVETDLILRLSTFAHRRIDNEKWLKKLPFVFAGDEFQTLNPTGFSWDSLRAYFTERLCKSIQRSESFAAPDPINLKKNYRSTPPVVRLANRLQLLRQTRCNTGNNTEPQEPFDTDVNAEPVFCLDAKDQDVWDRLVESHVSLIIPCADGQTPQDFLENSPAKGKLAFYDDGTPQGITVYNPIQAKGLEYPAVAIYGFDNEMPSELGLDELLQWFDRKSNKEPSAATEIGLKYFLSNAYVSATRAKQKLFVLGDFSLDSFWAFAFAEPDGSLLNKASTLEKRMLGTLRNPDEWTSSGNTNETGGNGGAEGRNRSKLGHILKGDIDNLSAGFVDAKTAAKTTESRALSLQDPGLMRQAAARHRELGDPKGEKRCEAYANLYGSNFKEAGRLFLAADESDEAVSSLWRSLDISLDETTLRLLAGIRASSRPEKKMAALVLRDSLTIRAFTQSVLELLQILDDGGQSTKERDFVLLTASVWQSVLSAMLAKIPRVAANDATAVRELLAHAKRADGYGISVSPQKRAVLAYNSGLLRDAIDLWRKAEKSNPNFDYPSDYHIALAKTDVFPVVILHWRNSKAENWARRVLDCYKENKDLHAGPLPEDIRRIVGEAAIKEGDREVISGFLPRILAKASSVEEAAESLRRASSAGLEFNERALLDLVRYRFNEIDFPAPNVSSPRSIREFRTMLRAAARLRQSGVRDEIRKRLEASGWRVNGILEEILGPFGANPWNALLFFETGRLFESPDLGIRHHAAADCYEWMERHAKDDWVLRDFRKRWIVCREKQVESMSNPENLEREIAEKRRELVQAGVLESETEPIPSVPEFNWIYYFIDILEGLPKEDAVRAPTVPAENVPAPVRASGPEEPRLPKEEPGAEPATVSAMDGGAAAAPPPAAAPTPKETPSGESEPSSPEPEAPEPETPEPVPPPAAASRFFDYPVPGFPGYSFRYKPGMELVFSCKTDRDDLRMRFRSAKFPEGGDFVLSEGKLLSDDGRETPFDVEAGSGSVRFRIRESGAEMVFPLPS